MHRIFGLILAICTVTGCAVVAPNKTAGAGTIYRLNADEFDVHFIVRGLASASDSRYRDELQNYAPGACGSSDYSVTQLNSGPSSRMVYGGGVFVNVTDEVASFRITCNPQSSVLPRIVMDTSDHPYPTAVLTVVNTSGILFDDQTGTVYVSINDQRMAKLPKQQWVRIAIEPGIHTLKLMHKDIGTFSKTYELDLPAGETIIKAWATPISTKYEGISSLPSNSKAYLLGSTK